MGQMQRRCRISKELAMSVRPKIVSRNGLFRFAVHSHALAAAHGAPKTTMTSLILAAGCTEQDPDQLSLL